MLSRSPQTVRSSSSSPPRTSPSEARLDAQRAQVRGRCAAAPLTPRETRRVPAQAGTACSGSAANRSTGCGSGAVAGCPDPLKAEVRLLSPRRAPSYTRRSPRPRVPPSPGVAFPRPAAAVPAPSRCPRPLGAPQRRVGRRRRRRLLSAASVPLARASGF